MEQITWHAALPTFTHHLQNPEKHQFLLQISNLVKTLELQARDQAPSMVVSERQ
jgi:hypothetical protein